MSATHRTYDNLPRILLVEDSDTSTVLVSRCLSGQYEVRRASDGLEAWDMLTGDGDIELVITDIQMPRLGGHALLRKIRACDMPRIKNVPVIVMTAADNNADRQQAFVNGASDFVGKPLEPLELQARVRVHQRLAHTIRELEASRVLLEEQATTDPLTRLKNRRAFADVGRRHFALARRHQHDLSVVMLDVDHFKEINDTHGHPTGDRVLAGIGQVLTDSVRSGDTPARLGGEEFAILLPNTGGQGAALLAERIRIAVARQRCVAPDSRIGVTASAGVACYSLDRPDNLEQLLEVADKRLYLAKQKGRNCVITAG